MQKHAVPFFFKTTTEYKQRGLGVIHRLETGRESEQQDEVDEEDEEDEVTFLLVFLL